MIRLIFGIVLVLSSILTWFSGAQIDEIICGTLTLLVVGILIILSGADKVMPRGIWAGKKKPDKPPKGHNGRIYKFDDENKIIGEKEVRVKD